MIIFIDYQPFSLFTHAYLVPDNGGQMTSTNIAFRCKSNVGDLVKSIAETIEASPNNEGIVFYVRAPEVFYDELITFARPVLKNYSARNITFKYLDEPNLPVSMEITTNELST